jgi:outer membrane protein assembly factor BamB
VAKRGDFPVHFGPGSNVAWKTSVPAGHSSPCLWGDRIFLTGFEAAQLETLCLDRRTGAVVWRRAITPEKIEPGSHNSSPAASTPATDGTRVYVYFGSLGLLCYDFAGDEQWRRPLPIPVTQHGTGTSPVVAGNRLLLACDQDTDSYLLAVETRTGRTVWKTDRPGFRRGFATPLLMPCDHSEWVMVAGTLRAVAYDLRDGAERWSVGGLPNELVASPVAGEGLVFVGGWTYGSGVSRMPRFEGLLEQSDSNHDGKLTREEAPAGPAKQHFLYIDADKDGLITAAEYESLAKIFDQSQNVMLAVRADRRGEMAGGQVQWKATRGLPYVPTPLYYEGRLYLVKNGGLASCLDARTGQAFYQEERLGALGDYYSSPVAARGKICVISQPGVAVIYETGDVLSVLARNSLGEPVMATPAIGEEHIYIRTKTQLYAFGPQVAAENAQLQSRH